MYDEECRRYALNFDGQASYAVVIILFLGLLLLSQAQRTRDSQHHLAGRDDFKKTREEPPDLEENYYPLQSP